MVIGFYRAELPYRKDTIDCYYGRYFTYSRFSCTYVDWRAYYRKGCRKRNINSIDNQYYFTYSRGFKYTLVTVHCFSSERFQRRIVAGLIIVAIIAAMVVFVVLLQDAQRKIPVQYSSKIQRQTSRWAVSQTCIPLKVNTSGVIPVIFAQSLMQTPVIIASFLGKGNGNGIGI